VARTATRRSWGGLARVGRGTHRHTPLLPVPLDGQTARLERLGLARLAAEHPDFVPGLAEQAAEQATHRAGTDYAHLQALVERAAGHRQRLRSGEGHPQAMAVGFECDPHIQLGRGAAVEL
jgi:hypothetical protein